MGEIPFTWNLIAIFVQKKCFRSLLGWYIRPRKNVQITIIMKFALHNEEV